MAEQNEAPEISAEDRIRMHKAAKLALAWSNFLRWNTNFERNTLTAHERHEGVFRLSAMQSARFSYCMVDDTLMLGVQPYESAWLAPLPVEAAHIVDHRLYLRIPAVSVMGQKFKEAAIGIHVSDARKLREMAQAKFLQPVRVTVVDGRVATVGEAMHVGIPIYTTDPVMALEEARIARQRRVDMKRYL